MLIQIPALLSADDLALFRAKLADADWQDGRATAGHLAAQVKRNQQLPLDHPLSKELGDLVLKRLGQSPLFIAAAIPKQVLPPRFNRYAGGGTYGNHIDNALFPLPDNSGYLRTDLSCTIFLNEPDDYEGGELIIEQGSEPHRIKWAAGDMVLYPSSSLHRVEPVTRGERLGCFFWVQSLIRRDDQRAQLFTLDQAIQDLTRDHGDHPALASLSGVYHNLLRQWAET